LLTDLHRGLTLCGQWAPRAALSANIDDVNCETCRAKTEAVNKAPENKPDR